MNRTFANNLSLRFRNLAVHSFAVPSCPYTNAMIMIDAA